MAANECIPYYEPGGRITAHAAASLTGKRFVRVSATKQAGSAGVSDSVLGGNVVVNTPSAGGRVLGVTSHDIASGKKGTIISTPGTVVPVTCAADITAFAEVEVDTAGRVIPKNTGVAVGVALADAANGADAMIKLY